MKINRIELVNFRNHFATAINLDQINIFVGRNNSGKSSIKAAIEYALTGRCEWTDGAGRGAEGLARHGAAAGSGVRLEVEGLGEISRAVPSELKVADWSGPQRTQQAQLYQELGAGADVISAALNTGRFPEMNPDEQKNMLFSLMGLEFTKQTITDALESFTTKAGKGNLLTADFFGYLKRFTGAAAGGPEVLDGIYKEVYKERTGVKKALKELEALAGAKQESALPPGAYENRQQIREELEKLKTRKEELIQIRGQAVGNQALVKRLQDELERLNEAYKEAYGELESITFDLDEWRELEESLPELRQKAEETRNHLDIQRNLAAGHKANLDAWTSARDRLKNNEHDRRCPIAPKLECTADIKAMLEQLGKEIDACAKLYESAFQETALMERDHKEADERYRQALARVEEFRRTDEHTKRLAHNIQEVDRKREAARVELEQAEKTTVSISGIEEEIDQLSQRIHRGEELLGAIAAEESVLEERNRLAGALEKKRQEVAWLEALVEAFGPKGMKASMLAGVVGKVQARANERLAMLTGGRYGLEFDLEKGFDIRVTMGDVTTGLKNLSTSERMRVGIILQDVLNSLTGLRLLVIDDCEILDPQNKGMLINLLLQIRDDYDTIIILSALGETQPRNPGIPGLSVFLVDNGAVRPVRENEVPAA